MIRVLILEQHANLKGLSRLELEEKGYELGAGENERELWERIPEVQPDMMVMDTLLYSEEGARWLLATRARFGRIPTVLFFGRPLQEKKAGGGSRAPTVFQVVGFGAAEADD